MRRGTRLLAAFIIAASLACAAEGEPEKDMTGWKWANFAILAAGIGFLLVKQAGPYFASRSIEIRKGIEEARQIRADAEARGAAMDARLAHLEVDVEALRTSSRAEAAGEGERIRQETAREIARIQANADQEIAAALKAAQRDLKDYSAQLAIDLARDKVRQRMTPAGRDTLVENFVADLARQDKGAAL